MNLPTIASSTDREASDWFIIFSTFVILFLVLLILSIFRFGSLTNAISYASGTRLAFDKTNYVLGTMRLDEDRVAVFRVRNLSGHEVNLIGARSSCSCVASKDLPVNLHPWDIRDIRVTVHGVQLGAISEKITYPN